MRRLFFGLFLALLCPMAANAALPCSAYPNTLTNGTLADANQVMANFNNILNCVNSLAPLGIPVVGSTSNIKAGLAVAGSTITVTADSVTVGTALNGTSYTLTSYSQGFNGGTTGPGGMDTGSLPTSGWVALYAIYNPTAPATSILGTNCATSCPTVYAGGAMPAGYTASALLTVLATNATPAIKPQYVRGKSIFYTFTQAASTAATIASLTSVSLTSLVPPDAVAITGGLLVDACGTGSSGQMTLTISSDSTGNGNTQLTVLCAGLGQTQTPLTTLLMPTAQTLWWQVNVLGTPSQLGAFYLNGYIIP